jgi:hypothetical protein
MNTVANKTTAPLSTEQQIDLKVKDYSTSLTLIAHHTTILEHALPLNRLPEIETSFKAVQAGVRDLHAFLKVRGYDV